MNNIKLPFFAAILTIGLLNSCGTDGCTDPTATNYNSDATKDDGSCEYHLQNISCLEHYPLIKL